MFYVFAWAPRPRGAARPRPEGEGRSIPHLQIDLARGVASRGGLLQLIWIPEDQDS